MSDTTRARRHAAELYSVSACHTMHRGGRNHPVADPPPPPAPAAPQPYSLKDVIKPHFAHSPEVRPDGKGGFLIFHVGAGILDFCFILTCYKRRPHAKEQPKTTTKNDVYPSNGVITVSVSICRMLMLGAWQSDDILGSPLQAPTTPYPAPTRRRTPANLFPTAPRVALDRSIRL